MTDEDTIRTHDRIDGSRRSVLRTGALASVGLGLGLGGSAVRSASAQEGEDEVFEDDVIGDPSWFQEDEAMEAVMYREAWVPNGLFTIASPVLEFQPDIAWAGGDFSDEYNSRSIRYMGTNEHVLFFPADDAALGPFEEGFGYVVDDDFVENDQIVVDGQPVGGELDDQELSALRPTIFIMSRYSDSLDGNNYLATVGFSPVPEQVEERVWNEFESDFGLE